MSTAVGRKPKLRTPYGEPCDEKGFPLPEPKSKFPPKEKESYWDWNVFPCLEDPADMLTEQVYRDLLARRKYERMGLSALAIPYDSIIQNKLVGPPPIPWEDTYWAKKFPRRIVTLWGVSNYRYKHPRMVALRFHDLKTVQLQCRYCRTVIERGNLCLDTSNIPDRGPVRCNEIYCLDCCDIEEFR